jgi:hypothetical protein
MFFIIISKTYVNKITYKSVNSDGLDKSRRPGLRPPFQPGGPPGRRVGDYTPEGENRGPMAL